MPFLKTRGLFFGLASICAQIETWEPNMSKQSTRIRLGRKRESEIQLSIRKCETRIQTVCDRKSDFSDQDLLSSIT